MYKYAMIWDINPVSTVTCSALDFPNSSTGLDLPLDLMQRRELVLIRYMRKVANLRNINRSRAPIVTYRHESVEVNPTLTNDKNVTHGPPN